MKFLANRKLGPGCDSDCILRRMRKDVGRRSGDIQSLEDSFDCGEVFRILLGLGMILLWLIVSSRISSMVQNNATNQMIDAVESRAAIINSYVTSAEE